MKKYLKTFELYRSTYYRAANRVHRNQPNRYDKLRQHGDEKGLYRNFFIPKYKFDIYVDFAINHTNGEEIYPKEILKNVIIEDYFELLDNNLGRFQFNIKKYYLSIDIEFNEDGVSIILFDVNNKFIHRKFAINLINLLHKFYIFHDPNTNRDVFHKLNSDDDSGLKKLTYQDIENEYDNFWRFLQSNGYDWNKFRKAIDINSLWDNIPTDRDISWVRNNT